MVAFGIAGCDPGTGKISIGGLDNSGQGVGGVGQGGSGGSGGGGAGGTGGSGGSGGTGGAGGTGGTGGGGTGGSGGSGGAGGSGGTGGSGGSGGAGGTPDMAQPMTSCTPGSTSFGNKSSFAVGQAQQMGSFILARDAKGFYAMDSTCPHALCPITNFQTPNQLVCDCHGAQWDFNGQNGQGPGRAQGSTLQHYAVCIDGSGNITVTSTKVAVTDRF